MTRDIDVEIHGQDLRISCLADYVELQAATTANSFSEAELADYIDNCNWQRILEAKYVGDGHELQRTGDRQEKSREAAKRVLEVLEQRQFILGDRYPFAIERGRRVRKAGQGEIYLWYLFISLAHGLQLSGVPDPAKEFEKVVSLSLNNAGIPSITVGTSTAGAEFENRISEITTHFPHLVGALDDTVRSRFLNDGGVDTFGALKCETDMRHGHWAFIGQSTVAKSDVWLAKIHEASPDFWHKVFGERVHAVPFFATPHHIQDDYLHLLFQNHRRCMLDRIRLTIWTPSLPDSFSSYQAAFGGVTLQ